LKTLEQSLAIQREVGERPGEAVTLNNISQLYDAWGRYEEASKTLEQGLAIQREIGDRAGEAVTLSNISQIYHAWDRNEEALKTLEQSLAIQREVGERPGEAVTLNNISTIYHAWGRNEEALKTLEQSLAISQEIGDRKSEAVTHAESTAIVAEIADLLGRAIQHGQPLFLIAIYEHEGDKLRLLEVLRRRLLEEGYTTQTLDPRHRPEHGLGRFYAALAECGPRALSLVSDLPRKTGGAALEPAFLEYFNLHRDRIARDRLRFLLFLHVVEMEDFVRLAGDMWDFRHRTYWLERPAGPRGAGLWQTMAERGATLPLPAAERELIDRHLAGVRAVLDGATDPEIKAGLLLDLCRWLTRRNAAGLAAEAALEGLGQLGDARTELRADLEGELGYALRKSSQLSEALRHFEQGLAVSREIGDRAGEAVTLNNISQIYHDWGRHEEALKLLERSLAIRREVGDCAGEAVTLNNISQIYHDWGRHEEALKTLEQSLAIYREIGDRAGEAGTLSNIAHIYHAWGRYEEALNLLEQSLAIYREICDRKGEAGTLNNISQIYDAGHGTRRP